MRTRTCLVALALVAACKVPDVTFTGTPSDGRPSDGTGDGARDGSVDAPPQFSSCTGLAATCGPNSNDSCCATATTLPGGSFSRSYDVSGDGTYPDPSFTATVGAFRLDKYLVTVGRFRQFVNAGMGTQVSAPAAGAGGRTLNGTPNQGGWDASWNGSLAANPAALSLAVKCNATYQSWTDTPAGNESRPMNCVDWYEAMAFCAWDGGFLPTEAEWNYAAAGGSEQRAYPWSNPPSSLTIDCTYANYYNGAYCVNPPTGAVNRVGSESPKGDGKWGQSDLAGNVYEWTLDWYASPYPQNPCTNCANLTVATYRVIRGGYFGNDATSLRAAYRSGYTPTLRDFGVGVRCARTP